MEYILTLIMIVIVFFIIYRFIVRYNKVGDSKACLIDTIAFSVLIILYPFYLIYDYSVNSFCKKNNNTEEKVNEKMNEKMMKKEKRRKKM